MKHANKHVIGLGAALLFSATSLLAQTAGTSGGTTTGSSSNVGKGPAGRGHGGDGKGTGSSPGAAHPHTPNPNASGTAQAVQMILQKFDASRDQYMAERKALIDQLATAQTAEERKAVLAALKSDMLSEKDQRAQLGKEIRNELKTLRQQRKAGGG
jgi:hypothetical protein